MIWPAVIAAVGAVAGAAVSASMSKSANKDLMQDQNAMNMYNYARRYQLTTEDMRKAGLNPILAATGGFSVGNAPQVQTHAPDLSAIASGFGALASSAKAFEEAEKIDVETEKIKEEITKVKQEALTELERTATQRGITALTEAQIKTEVTKQALTGFQAMESSAHTQKMQKEMGLIGAQTYMTEKLGEKAGQDTKTGKAQEQLLLQEVQVGIARVEQLVNETILLKQKRALTEQETNKIVQEITILKANSEKLKNLGDIYNTSYGKVLNVIGATSEALGIKTSDVIPR